MSGDHALVVIVATNSQFNVHLISVIYFQFICFKLWRFNEVPRELDFFQKIYLVIF